MLAQDLLASVQLMVFDFDGVLTDNTVAVDQHGTESVRCWRSDGLGLARVRSVGVQTYIVSTEMNPVVSQRAAKLKIACVQGVEDKAAAIAHICQQLGVDVQRTLFVGNDINDIPAFKTVGLPVAVADAYPEVYPYVLYRTEKPGGLGAVREICDLVFHARSPVSGEGRP